MRLERAEGNWRRGDCKMLKIMIVEKAMVASMEFPSSMKVRKVKKIIRGQLKKYKKTMRTSKNPRCLLELSYSLRFTSSFLKKYFSMALILINRMMSSISSVTFILASLALRVFSLTLEMRLAR